jgi:actin-related protein 6
VYNDTPTLFGDPPRTVNTPAEILMVVDSGYSHTTVTPLLRGRPLQSAIRRLTVGGKFMTNYLKELLSIRHYSMMDETHLVNEIKEDVSFVSLDYARDLDRTWKGYQGRKHDLEDLRVD